EVLPERLAGVERDHVAGEHGAARGALRTLVEPAFEADVDARDAEAVDQPQRGPEQRVLVDRVAQRARREQRDEGGERADVADAPDEPARPDRADHEAGEIGRADRPHRQGGAACALEADGDQRRHEAAACHQHEDGEQQAADRGDCAQHIGIMASRDIVPAQAAARPLPAGTESSTSAACSARTPRSKSPRSTMNWTSTLRIWCWTARVSTPASSSARSARGTTPGSDISLPIAAIIATGWAETVAAG